MNAQTITLTEHERREFGRFAAALEQRGGCAQLVARCRLWAVLPHGAAVRLDEFDVTATAYRAWLVFGEIAA